MIEIESTVAAALREDEQRPVRADGLHERALARARVIRGRRRVLGAAAGTGLTVAMIAGLVAVNGLARGGSAVVADPPAGAPAALPVPPREPTTLPRAEGVPGAADAPSAVGTDARVLHFDLALAGLDVVSAEWTSAPGYERVVASTDSGSSPTEVLIGRDPARIDEVAVAPTSFVTGRETRAGKPEPTTVGGRPATLVRHSLLGRDDAYGWVLSWQPVDGLYARVRVVDDKSSTAFVAARALRLHVAQRCTVPLLVQTPPANATLTDCMTAVRRRPVPVRGVWMHSLLTYTTDRGGHPRIWAEEDLPRAGIDTLQFVPNTTAGGHPAMWRTREPRGLWVLGFDPAGELFIDGTSRSESIRVAGGVSVVGDLADPSTWPTLG